MLNIKVIFENGDFLYTKINGTLETIKNYYIGKVFNTGKTSDNLQKCTSIEILD